MDINNNRAPPAHPTESGNGAAPQPRSTADSTGQPGSASIALDETPSAMPTQIGPTQIPDPVWGKYNDPAQILNLVETRIVEL